MKSVLIIGNNAIGRHYTNAIQQYSSMKIIAIVIQEYANLEPLPNDITVSLHASDYREHQIDYIFHCDPKISFIDSFVSNPLILNHEQLTRLQPFLEAFTLQYQHMDLILNNIRDGLIVIDQFGNVQFMNKAAKETFDMHENTNIKQQIKQLIPNSRLPHVLRSQEKEINQKLLLKNSREIVTTRIPLVNNEDRLIGAFAIFKDSEEIRKLAEENTNLSEIKTILETIIYSSDEAISVVDENGNGWMINEAYTRITGLTESDIINKPASTDISEGHSIHMEVLHTRREIRGARLKVGPHHKDVIVHATPIIVSGKLKGSVGIIRDISEVESLSMELKQARQMIRNLESTYMFEDIIGDTPELNIAIEQSKIGAKTDTNVLLRGNAGTGKEIFARAIHNESDRKYHRFVHINLATYSEEEIARELFGFMSEVHSDAHTSHVKGLLEEANNGTIFLDEISVLTLQTQRAILDVIRNKQITPMGSRSKVKLDIKIITATSAHLEKDIMEGLFSDELFHEINKLPIFVPKLINRVKDIATFVNYVILKLNDLYGRRVEQISSEALNELRNHHWPGNIRELENVLSYAMISMQVTEKIIQLRHLPTMNNEQVNDLNMKLPKNKTLQAATEDFEKAFIKQVLQDNQHNKTTTAKQLGISVRSLYYKLEKYEL